MSNEPRRLIVFVEAEGFVSSVKLYKLFRPLSGALAAARDGFRFSGANRSEAPMKLTPNLPYPKPITGCC